MKKITLQVNGREMTFSEEELVAILEEHYGDKTSKTKIRTARTAQGEIIEIAKTPTEGKCFEVKPSSIDRKLFQEKRADEHEERLRGLILKAFAEVDKHPEKYAKDFKTMIPIKDWSKRTMNGLIRIAKELGDHIADWVEKALEFAQRISNGETWEAVSRKKDANIWHQMVKAPNGGWVEHYWLIGGIVSHTLPSAASQIHLDLRYDGDGRWLDGTVPSVVL